jgi:hypothetical protein
LSEDLNCRCLQQCDSAVSSAGFRRPGKHSGTGGHLWLAYRRIGFQCKHLDNQRHQDRRDILAQTIFYREQLYSDFISQGAHAMSDAIQHNYHDPMLPRRGEWVFGSREGTTLNPSNVLRRNVQP